MRKEEDYKGFWIKKYSIWVFWLKIINLQLRGCWKKCKMREEGNFQAKTRPGIQDFILCVKKPGNKYKIQEMWGFCMENRDFIYHRREGGATISHLVLPLWKTPKITKNLLYGKNPCEPWGVSRSLKYPPNYPKMSFNTPNAFFHPTETSWGLFWSPLPPNAPQTFQTLKMFSKIPQVLIKIVFLPKFSHFGSKYLFPQSPLHPPPLLVKIELNKD